MRTMVVVMPVKRMIRYEYASQTSKDPVIECNVINKNSSTNGVGAAVLVTCTTWWAVVGATPVLRVDRWMWLWVRSGVVADVEANVKDSILWNTCFFLRCISF